MIFRLLVLVLLVAPNLPGQAILRPTGRVIPGTPAPAPTATPTPTTTPTPDPCAGCPEPDSFTCQMWPNVCYQCWEDCGRPIATPTVTPTPQPTRTPTPPPTPTPHGPACELRLPGAGWVYLTAVYKHESSTYGVRYTFKTEAKWLESWQVARPCPCEGEPVGFAWSFAANSEPFMECGDTGWRHWHIFSDGFEGGDLGAWDE